MRAPSIAVLSAALMWPPLSQGLSLTELEAQIDDSIAVKIADSELARSQAFRDLRAAEAGWKLLGNVGLSHNVQVVGQEGSLDFQGPFSATGTGIGAPSPDGVLRGRADGQLSATLGSRVGTRTFEMVSARVGARYPLLGTRLSERIALLAAQAQVDISAARRSLAEREVLFAVRQNYIDVWAAQRRIDLSRRFLEEEEYIRKTLGDRTHSGMLLESGRLDYLSTFDLARRQIAYSESRRQTGIASLKLLTNAAWQTFVAENPSLLPPCLNESRIADQLTEQHPELLVLKRLVAEKSDETQFANYRSLEAGLNITQDFTRELQLPENGYSTYVGIDVRAPLSFLNANRAYIDQATAALSKACLEFDLRFRELQAQAVELNYTYRALQEGAQFAMTRLAAAEENLRERKLREEMIDGETIELLHQGRYQYYLAAVETVDADAAQLLHQAKMLALNPTGCGELAEADGQPANRTRGRASSGGQARPSKAHAAGLRVYVWDSQSVLNADTESEGLWAQFAQRGVKRLLLALNAGQLEAMTLSAERTRLNAFIRTARSQGIKTDLLLGEPGWILPAHRHKLVEIVNKTKALQFSGLHLDLEPNQLDEAHYKPAYLLEELSRTLAAVKAVSPWPVALSIHPRYLIMHLNQSDLGTRLMQVGIDEVCLMIYARNPERVSAIAAPILKQFHKLKFSVAVSLEDQLPREETNAGRTLVEFRKTAASIAEDLAAANFTGITVQAWEQFRRIQ